VRAREAAHPDHQGATRVCPHSFQPRQALPKNIVVLPVLFEGETKAVIELSSLQPFTATHLAFLEQLTQSIGVVLNTIEATMRTENLLQQSQQLTIELQTRQTELQQTNEQLALKAQQLANRTSRSSGRTRKSSRRGGRWRKRRRNWR
jgi:GAF domain-containing protein